MLSLPVPIIRQCYAWTCGSACVASALYYYDVWAGREPELYSKLETNEEDGTSGYKIIEVIEEFGLKARSASGMDFEQLRGHLERKEIVILSLQSPDVVNEEIDWENLWESGHYSILAGLDDEWIWLMDPELPAKYRVLKRLDFEKRWHEYSDDGEYEWHSGIIICKQ
jgi:predicted double-glycine peptidase